MATAFFDGTIGIHSIQSTNESPSGGISSTAAPNDAADIFDVPGFSRSSQGTLSLKQPPKWLRRPVSHSFGFGGKFVTVSNLPSAQGKHQSSVVHLRKIVTEQDVLDRINKLQTAMKQNKLNSFATNRGGDEHDAETAAHWRALSSLFRADSRDELVTLLGYSKTGIVARVAEAIETLKLSADDSVLKSPSEDHATDSKSHEPVVSFAEPESQAFPSDNSDTEADETRHDHAVEKTPSEISASAGSDATRLADAESATSASLFGDDNTFGALQADAGADFFSTIGVGEPSSGELQQVRIPHHNYGLDSSVAATIGSRPSSTVSENIKNNNFRIYPSDASEVDQLITKALVLGDFQSAVSLCLSTERYADAILLAVKGGPELLQSTQKAYFERRTTSLPYLRLFQSIVTDDLADIVQNADLRDWQEIFVVLCTFAGQEEFSSLAEQLGSRLEFHSTLFKSSDAPGSNAKAHELRKNAMLTYLAAGRLERLVTIWVDEMTEDEKNYMSDQERPHNSRFTAHAHALQTFIEKVTVFRAAIEYTDIDLSQSTGDDASAKTYKLSGLYDRYYEYADLLASQGLLVEAVAFLKSTPADYKVASKPTVGPGEERDRILRAAEGPAVEKTPTIEPTAKTMPAPVQVYGYADYSNNTATACPSFQCRTRGRICAIQSTRCTCPQPGLCSSTSSNSTLSTHRLLVHCLRPVCPSSCSTTPTAAAHGEGCVTTSSDTVRWISRTTACCCPSASRQTAREWGLE